MTTLRNSQLALLESGGDASFLAFPVSGKHCLRPVSLALPRNDCSPAVTAELHRQWILKTALGARILVGRSSGPSPGAPCKHLSFNEGVAGKRGLLRFLRSQHELRRFRRIILAQ